MRLGKGRASPIRDPNRVVEQIVSGQEDSDSELEEQIFTQAGESEAAWEEYLVDYHPSGGT